MDLYPFIKTMFWSAFAFIAAASFINVGSKIAYLLRWGVD